MNTPLRISIPHELGRTEARRRIEDGFSKLALQLPGLLGQIAGAFKDRLRKAGQLLLTKD